MQLPKRKPGKYALENPDHNITKEKLAQLKTDYEKLKKRQPSAAREVARLAELGDFSENVEYQLAKRRLRGINSAILKIDYKINHSNIIEPKQNETVEIGHTVVVNMADGQKKYKILGSQEASPANGVISHNSPIGSALLGHKVGELVAIEIREKTVMCEIISIKS
jgi:transcription elongation factor GreA